MALADCTPVTGTRWELFFTTPAKKQHRQASSLLRHIRERGINALRVEWGRPTLVLRDPDGNELFFWIPDIEWANLPPDLPPLYT